MGVNHMIDIDGISKIYEGKNGRVTANDHISLHVNCGEIVGLLGHNGADVVKIAVWCVLGFAVSIGILNQS